MILDTNALSAWADGLPAARPHLAAASKLLVPVIVLGEYQYGIRQSRHRARYEEWLARYLPLAEVLPVTADTVGHCADLRLHLKSRGTPIPANDLWIAAFVQQHRQPILSNDTHFDPIPGLLRIPF